MIKFLNITIFILIAFTKVNAQNYNEAEVRAYTLPEVLKASDGTIIKNKASWKNKRRPEIIKLFEHHVYGEIPKEYDSLQFLITNEDAKAINGKAHLKEVSVTIWRKSKSVIIRLNLFIPNHVDNPTPAFLLINNRDKDNTDPTRKIQSDFWPVEMVIDSGYAIAAFHVSDAAPDHPDSYQNGVLKLYPEQLKAENGMKAIGAWGWAASRVMDYFEKDKDIDAKKVCLVGHSRGGKASLWAGAQDQRFAIVISNNSGNTGAALSRRNFGESVKVINNAFPHWFADNYKKYNDNETALPVDQHMLIALIAPRPVYTTTASEDLWGDPKGSFLSLKHAEEVYRLYNKNSSLPPEPPRVNTPVINSILGYHNREGEHNLTAYDWKNFILFANYHLK